MQYFFSFAFFTNWVASLTGLRALVCIVMLWAGAMTLSLGVEQKEKCIARQAVAGLRAPARLAALVTPLTPSRGVFCIIPFPALGQALLSQLEPAWSAGETLHAVSSFTCPTRAVAGGTPVAVLISVIVLRAVLHTGCVEKEAVPQAGETLVLGGSGAAEALGVTGLAAQSPLIPVLGGGAFFVRHTLPVVVHAQAFRTRRAGPRRRAGLAGLVAIFAIFSLFFIVSPCRTLIQTLSIIKNQG